MSNFPESTTYYDMAEYWGNGGFSVSGYDCTEVNHAVSQLLEAHLSAFLKDFPEPSPDDYVDDYGDDYLYECAYDLWADDLQSEMADYLAKLMNTPQFDHILEENFHPIEWLCEHCGIDEAEAERLTDKPDLMPEDLDEIARELDD